MSAERVTAVGRTAFLAARDRAVGALRGTVLEIGAGEGTGLEALAPGVRWLGLEPDERRRARLAVRARAHGHEDAPLAAPAEEIPLADGSVDAVLALSVLCSVTDPVRVLAEVQRVVRPGGRVVLAEHVAATAGSSSAAVLRLVRPLTRRFDHNCDPTRDTLGHVRRSGLRTDRLTEVAVRVLPGLTIPMVVIEATGVSPPRSGGAAV